MPRLYATNPERLGSLLSGWSTVTASAGLPIARSTLARRNSTSSWISTGTFPWIRASASTASSSWPFSKWIFANR